MNINQIEMASVDSLVDINHPYRKLKESLDFDLLIGSVRFDIAVYRESI